MGSLLVIKIICSLLVYFLKDTMVHKKIICLQKQEYWGPRIYERKQKRIIKKKNKTGN